MSKRRKKRRRTSTTQEIPTPQEAPSHPGWIPPRTGVFIITLISLALAFFVGIQVYWKTGMADAAFRMAVVYGASIWVIFGLVLVITQILRRRNA
ncbi:MAG: hypothetical protein GXO55_09060 [Chloroflexi bacterium]|nr:hypothetical protein [Chloroflexota bacterium]